MLSKKPDKPPLSNGEEVDVTMPVSSNSIRDEQSNSNNSIMKKNRVVSDDSH